MKMQRLERCQRLIVITAQQRMITGADQRREQAVGRQRAVDRDAFALQLVDRRFDYPRFLVAQLAALAGMRVQPGDGDLGLGNAEIAAQRPRDDARLADDRFHRQPLGHFGNRDVDGQWHDAQRRPRQHHHRIGRGDAASFGDEFGLAGMGVTDAVQRLFRHRPGDQRRAGLGAGQADAGFQRMQRTGRAGWGRSAEGQRAAVLQVPEGQGVVEGANDVGHAADPLDRAVPDGGDRGGVADGDEGRQPLIAPRHPGTRRHLGSDAGRVTHGDRDRAAMGGWKHQLYSITASRRRSRR